MTLGNFSVSLDIALSRAFYEKLGFDMFGGDESQGWLIMKGPSCTIGLFQGMFEKNTLTFNPGWNDDGQALDTFTDIREIQKRLKWPSASDRAWLITLTSGVLASSRVKLERTMRSGLFTTIL